MVSAALVHRFTIDDDERTGEVGILKSDGRDEPIDGQVFEIAPERPLRSSAMSALTDFFVSASRDRYLTRIQNPIRLDATNLPEPHIAFVTWRSDRYRSAHPAAADAFLVIEISGSSLANDRSDKLRLYATAGIVEYWIVNPRRRRHRSPP